MPDKWGRPTFNDGFQIAQGIRYIQEGQAIDQERGVEKDSFVVADALNKGSGQADLSQYSPEARFKGAQLYWEHGVADLDKQIKQKQLSAEGLNLKVAQMKERQVAGQALLKTYQAARKSGDDSTARVIGKQLFNDYMYNGMYAEDQEGGKVKVTGWEHDTQIIDDLSLEEYDEGIGAYFSMPAEKVLEIGISGDMMRQKTNLGLISKAEPQWDPSTGRTAYLVPSGTWTPDGKPRGAFYVDNPVSQKEVPAEQAKGFVPLNPSTAKAFGKGSEKDTRTTDQKEFDRHKKNTDYKGDILDYKTKAAKAKGAGKNIRAEAIKLAQNDPDVFSGQKTVNEVLPEYMKMLQPDQDNGSDDPVKLPETITKTSEALKFLVEDQGMTEDEAREYIRKNYASN